VVCLLMFLFRGDKAKRQEVKVLTNKLESYST
jgi:hypothetical protein